MRASWLIGLTLWSDQAAPLAAATAVLAQSGTRIIASAEIVGYFAAFTLVISVATGGIFGRRSRRILNALFGSARRRVSFHTLASFGLTLAAVVHTAMFFAIAADGPYHWSLGLIWGGLGLLCMFGLGITGAIQVPIIRHWNYPAWRWLHFGLAIGALVFTIIHILLDGAHFEYLQDKIGWHNPLESRADTD